MTAARVFCGTAAALFLASCVCYRLRRALMGDRLLFVAYCMVLCAALDIIGRLRA